jgi:Tfp pilus assembly protein PilV
VRARVRDESGFGLIELLMAITILNVGVLAIVAAFNAGIFAIKRASQVSTAAVLADQQLEKFRAVTYDKIGLDSSLLSSVNSTYTCDTALGSGACPRSTSGETTMTCSPVVDTCTPWRTVTGPDRHQYAVATYIFTENPVATARQVRRVVVVVRDGLTTSKVLARESSSFDCSTGLPGGSTPPSSTYCPST